MRKLFEMESMINLQQSFTMLIILYEGVE